MKNIILILLTLFSTNFAFSDNKPVVMTRKKVLEISSNYVKGLYNPGVYQSQWKPKIIQATNTDKPHSVIFKSFFTKNGYLIQGDPQRNSAAGTPSGRFTYDTHGKNFTIGQKSGNNSIYWVVPYCLGEFENPAFVKKRVEASKNDKIAVPGTDILGGNNTKTVIPHMTLTLNNVALNSVILNRIILNSFQGYFRIFSGSLLFRDMPTFVCCLNRVFGNIL